MAGEIDRRAVFSFGLGYFDGASDTILTADEVGFITDEPRGDNLHGWTELLYVYGYNTFPGRSLAELDDDEWQEYLASIEEVDVFAKLRDFLVKKSWWSCSCPKSICAVLEKSGGKSLCVLNKTNLNFANF